MGWYKSWFFSAKSNFFVLSKFGLSPFADDRALNLEGLQVRQSFYRVVGVSVVPLRPPFEQWMHLHSVHYFSAATHLQARVLHVDRALHWQQRSTYNGELNRFRVGLDGIGTMGGRMGVELRGPYRLYKTVIQS